MVPRVVRWPSSPKNKAPEKLPMSSSPWRRKNRFPMGSESNEHSSPLQMHTGARAPEQR